MKNLLLATAAILAAFILPSHAATNDLVDGAAAVLLYAEHCKAADIKPELMLLAQIWQRKYPADVQASRDAFVSKGNQAVPGLSFVDLAPMWCVMMKNKLPQDSSDRARHEQTEITEIIREEDVRMKRECVTGKYVKYQWCKDLRKSGLKENFDMDAYFEQRNHAK